MHTIDNLNVPEFLFHRTSCENYLRIVVDGKIKCLGTDASCIRFREAKFDEKGNDTWCCVFLADSIPMTRALTWGGDVVLKISTAGMDKMKLEHDGNADIFCFTHSFRYHADIPISEVAEVLHDKWTLCRLDAVNLFQGQLKKRLMK